MKKPNLQEELKRIHEMSGNKTQLNENFIDDLLSFLGFKDKGEKKDIKISNIKIKDVKDFYDILESIKKDLKSDGDANKIQAMQVGLMLLGYDLPNNGADGIYGEETKSAVKKFKKENNISDEKIDEGVIGSIMNEFELIEESYDILKFETIVESDDKVSGSVMPVKGIKVMIKKLTEKGISFEDLQKYFNKSFYSGEVNDKNVYEKILEGIGAKPTPENMKFMYAWRQSEGKAGRYNPFNTTQPMPGATNFNSVGVKHYLSLEDGVNATIKTLLNGYYPCIVNGLRNDIGADKIAKCESLKTWGTGDLVSKVIASYDRGAKPNVSSLA